MTPPPPKSKDSMKSTWRNDPSSWRIGHYILNHSNSFYIDTKEPVPVFEKSDPVPVLSEWSTNAFVFAHAAWPMLVHRLYLAFTGHNPPILAAFALYAIAWYINIIREVRALWRLAQKVGFLDGDKAPRDEVPDVGVDKVVVSLLFSTIRPASMLYLAYKPNETPSLSWWLPVELFLFSVILDLWFYIYHRSCHEIDFLWKFHRTHHLTKHPNPFLTSYADEEQEVIELFLVPMLTYGVLKLMGLPMGFFDWWTCQQFLAFTEILGHSGLRVYGNAAGVSSSILKFFDCELTVEDHDLHHRRGWKKSHNYGKQTRVWDKLFGTSIPRIEVVKPDHNLKVHLTLA